MPNASIWMRWLGEVCVCARAQWLLILRFIISLLSMLGTKHWSQQSNIKIIKLMQLLYLCPIHRFKVAFDGNYRNTLLSLYKVSLATLVFTARRHQSDICTVIITDPQIKLLLIIQDNQGRFTINFQVGENLPQI